MDDLKELVLVIVGAQPGILALVLGIVAVLVTGYALHIVHLSLRRGAR